MLRVHGVSASQIWDKGTQIGSLQSCSSKHNHSCWRSVDRCKLRRERMLAFLFIKLAMKRMGWFSGTSAGLINFVFIQMKDSFTLGVNFGENWQYFFKKQQASIQISNNTGYLVWRGNSYFDLCYSHTDYMITGSISLFQSSESYCMNKKFTAAKPSLDSWLDSSQRWGTLRQIEMTAWLIPRDLAPLSWLLS